MLLAANTDTLIYTVPTSTVADKNVRFCETGGAAATVRLSRTTGSTLVADDAVLWEFPLNANGYIELGQLFLNAGDKLYARASTAAVAVNHFGPEDAA